MYRYTQAVGSSQRNSRAGRKNYNVLWLLGDDFAVLPNVHWSSMGTSRFACALGRPSQHPAPTDLENSSRFLIGRFFAFKARGPQVTDTDRVPAARLRAFGRMTISTSRSSRVRKRRRRSEENRESL